MSARSQFLATSSGTETGAAGNYLLNTLNLAIADPSRPATAELVVSTMALAKEAGADQRFTSYVQKDLPGYASLIAPQESVAEAKPAPVARTVVKMGSGM